MKYFRYYPVWLQLILFLSLVFTLMFFGMVCLYVLLPLLSGVRFDQIQVVNEHSSYALVKASQLVQGVLSSFMFLVPALLFAYLTHPEAGKYLGLKKAGSIVQFLLVIIIMLSAKPALEAISGLVSKIDFGADVKKGQDVNDSLMKAYLNMPTFVDFLRVFFVMAILPAMGEELFFRGVLMRFTMKISKSLWLSVIFSAALFAFIHSNIYGLASIFLAGALLAGIYYLTGSLWCSIAGHMVFNGSQIILSYIGNTNGAVKNFENSETIQWGLVGGGAVVFAIAFYLLWKIRTPLAANWTEDFDAPVTLPEPQELSN